MGLGDTNLNFFLVFVAILGLDMGLSGITYSNKDEKLSQTEKNKNKFIIGLLVTFLLLNVGFWYYQWVKFISPGLRAEQANRS